MTLAFEFFPGFFVPECLDSMLGFELICAGFATEPVFFAGGTGALNCCVLGALYLAPDPLGKLMAGDGAVLSKSFFRFGSVWIFAVADAVTRVEVIDEPLLAWVATNGFALGLIAKIAASLVGALGNGIVYGVLLVCGVFQVAANVDGLSGF